MLRPEIYGVFFKQEALMTYRLIAVIAGAMQAMSIAVLTLSVVAAPRGLVFADHPNYDGDCKQSQYNCDKNNCDSVGKCTTPTDCAC
jgi:hypothetical protein